MPASKRTTKSVHIVSFKNSQSPFYLSELVLCGLKRVLYISSKNLSQDGVDSFRVSTLLILSAIQTLDFRKVLLYVKK